MISSEHAQDLLLQVMCQYSQAFIAFYVITNSLVWMGWICKCK
jgi:hypothetical protein